MNNTLKMTLFGVITFAAGGAAGYLVAEKVLRERYLDDLDELKIYYGKKLKELGVMDEDFEAELFVEDEDEDEEVDNEDEDEEEDEDDRAHFERVVKGYKNSSKGQRTPIINYNQIPLHEILADIENEDEEESFDPSDDHDYEEELEARAEEYARIRNERRNNGDPYLIKYDEYDDGPEGYEKQALYYYTLDRTLCEDDDSIVEDEEELVGFDYEDVLDMQTTAWVRNDKIATLYEIHRVRDSYRAAVANVIETPRERDFRIKGRRKAALDD